MDILNVTEKPEIDLSIEEYEYHSYEPMLSSSWLLNMKCLVILK